MEKEAISFLCTDCFTSLFKEGLFSLMLFIIVNILLNYLTILFILNLVNFFMNVQLYNLTTLFFLMNMLFKVGIAILFVMVIFIVLYYGLKQCPYKQYSFIDV